MSDQPVSELVKALVAAQAEMKAPVKDQENPHYKSKFASLGSVRDATLPALTAHGLSIHHETGFVDGKFVLIGKLEHVSGECREAVWPLAEGKPQEMGSALTYGRRYTWEALCGVVAEEDDDGQAAQDASAKQAKASAKSPATNDEPPTNGFRDDNHKKLYALLEETAKVHNLPWTEVQKVSAMRYGGISDPKDLADNNLSDYIAFIKKQMGAAK